MGDSTALGSCADKVANWPGEATLERLIKERVVRHYGVVLDRSDRARATVESMRGSGAEFRARLDSDAFRAWEATTHQFAILWGTIGTPGGLTIGAVSLPELLERGIPAAVDRSKERGGLCTFMVAVDPSLESRVRAKVAAMQPIPGTSSSEQPTLRKRMHMATDGKQLRQMNVPRQMVERGDWTALIKELSDCVATQEMARLTRGSMVVSFDGYDEDPRQVWDVPEVRSFVRQVCKAVPWWTHYPAPQLGMTTVWTLSLREDAVSSSFATNKTFVKIDPAKTMASLKEALTATGELYRRLGWVDAEADSGFAAVVDQALDGLPGNGATAMQLKKWWAEIKGRAEAAAKGSQVADESLVGKEPTGLEVDFSKVQITGPAFDRIMEILLNCESMAATESTAEVPRTVAHELEDGSLVVKIIESSGRRHQVIVARGDWKPLTDEEVRKLATEAKRQLKAEGSIGTQTSAMTKGIDHAGTREASVNAQIDSAMQVLVLFSKEVASLASLKILKEGSPELGVRIEAWLAGQGAYLIVSMGRTPAGCWTTEAKSLGDLCESVLPGLAPHVLSISKTMLVPDSLNEGDRTRTAAVWSGLGGTVQVGA